MDDKGGIGKAIWGVSVQTQTEVVSLELSTKKLFIQNGRSFSFDTLIIATGSNQQFKNVLKSTHIRSVKETHLRTSLEQSLEKAEKVAVIGAGQVGLELAESLYQQKKRSPFV